MDLENINIPISSKTGDALLQPPAESIGNATKVVLDSFFYLVLGPLKKYNMTQEKNLELFKEKLDEKYRKIPIENLDDSKIGLVYKALEDARYQLSDEIIREMFANLICNALDNTKNNSLNPYFSTIISNMTVKEASLLQIMYTDEYQMLASCELFLLDKVTGNKSSLRTKYILIPEDHELASSSSLELELLETHKLIDFVERGKLTNPHFEKLYNEFEIDAQNAQTKPIDRELLIEKSHYRLTFIGEEFCKVVF